MLLIGGDLVTEEILIKKAQNGDSQAFNYLIKGYFKKLYNIAYRMSNNADDAADMTQEIMIKLFKNISSYSGDSKFSTWVYRVATNTCLDELKKIKRHRNYSIDKEIETDDGDFTGEIEDTAPTAEQLAEQNELKSIVKSAISMLSPDYKAIIILRDIQGLSYGEIAQVLGCTNGTVKSRISRARAQLKIIIENNFNIDGTYFKT